MTTIKDLYNWAIENNALELPIGIQFQDSGGCYDGNTFKEYGVHLDIHVAIDKCFNQQYVLLE